MFSLGSMSLRTSASMATNLSIVCSKTASGGLALAKRFMYWLLSLSQSSR